MMPAHVGVANQTAGKLDLPITLQQIKPGNCIVSNTLTVTQTSGKGQVKCQQSKQEEFRNLPVSSIPAKPRNLTIGTINNNNNSNRINNNATANKNKLTQMNIVQKQLKPSQNLTTTTTVTQPLIQLVATKNSNSMLSILTPKTLITAPNQLQSTPMATTATTSSSSQPMVIRPAMTTIPAAQQNGASKASSPGAQSSHLMALVNKTPATAPAHLSLISNTLKSRAPVILSKAAVEKIRFKFGQVQAQANAGALVLTKPIRCSNINNNKNKNINGQSVQTLPGTSLPVQDALVASTIAEKPLNVAPALKLVPLTTSPSAPLPTSVPTLTVKPTPTARIGLTSKAQPMPKPLPMAMPSKTNVNVSEIKINPLPAVTENGSKVMKVPACTLSVVVPTVAAQTAAATATSSTTPQSPQSWSKLQRSKSLASREDNALVICSQNNAVERRHSVAIMAKEVDVVEQINPIETITIDDDDSEEEDQAKDANKQLPQPQAQPLAQAMPCMEKRTTPTTSTQTSRKTSTTSRSSIASNSSSDVEMIIVPSSKPQQQLEANQQKEQPSANVINIVKAETLSLSKEDFEKALRCDEDVDNSPTSSASTSSLSKKKSVTSDSEAGIISKTPLARFKNKVQQEHIGSSSNFRRNMQLNFDMLRWREQQPVTLQSSSMRFELNRFNLLQLAERCEPRKGPAAYFERSLYERPNRRSNSSSHPLLYLCSKCKCHGPASDFLAPRFCSVACVKRANKRRQPPSATNNASENKIRRISDGKQLTNGQPQQQQREKEKDRESEGVREKDRKSAVTKRPFRWTEYLKLKGNSNAAPIHLFLNPFPISPNCFERNMKLEAVDPENCSLFCVCTIVEVRGYRLKLSFDGYSSMYDFWVNADSMDIFPPGWCESSKRTLQPPKGHFSKEFNWLRYLMKTNSKAAPIALFTHLNESTQPSINGFKVGMHLEAEDLNDTGKICVATVADILDERIRVHFDGWDDCYDFWVHVNSPYIHPCGWHEGRQQLIVPPDFQNIAFNWSNYIRQVGGVAAPVNLFAPREPMEFQAHMKLEVVDQRNPYLIRPATVVTRKGYRVQLHMDCWPSEYFFWLEDDSPDLHPIGWCEATSHELESPPGFLQRPSQMPCDIEGCRGYGNAKRFNFDVHALRDCCPYAPENWRQWRAKTVKPPRVQPEHIKTATIPNDVSASPLQTCLDNGNTKPSAEARTQHKVEKTRPRWQSEPKPIPKLKNESRKSVTIEVKPEDEKLLSAKSSDISVVDINPRGMSIAKTIVEEYGPQFVRNYQLWQKNSDFNMEQLRSNPLYWTNWDVYEFVERALKSSQIAQMLFDEEIDGRAFLMLGRKDLTTYFNLKLGPTVKLFSLIVNLRIAVACKFSTRRTGLNINAVRQPLASESVKHREEIKNTPKANLDNHLVASPDSSTSEDFKVEPGEEEMELEEEADAEDDNADEDYDYKHYSDYELTDDEDVMLDSEDFLSVKPSQSIIHSVATNNNVDQNSLAVMSSRTAVAASVPSQM